MFSTVREIAAPPELVFAAFSQPQRLAKWWGPKDFTSTFNVCEFRTGGRWSLIMHGPDGKNYANESIFAEIEPAKKIVIEHVSKPKYRLTILLSPAKEGTAVSWNQEFENSKFAESMKPFLSAANEQNLDRLSKEVTDPSA